MLHIFVMAMGPKLSWPLKIYCHLIFDNFQKCRNEFIDFLGDIRHIEVFSVFYTTNLCVFTQITDQFLPSGFNYLNLVSITIFFRANMFKNTIFARNKLGHVYIIQNLCSTLFLICQ